MTHSASAEPRDRSIGDLYDHDGHDAAESANNQRVHDGNHPEVSHRITGDGVSWELHHLRRRMETQPVIEQSKGILMGRYGVDADTAFEVLRRLASDHNIKLRDISRSIVAAAISGHSTGGSRPTLGALLYDIETSRPRSREPMRT